jgi:nucleoside-diphosphate-sugar epimerase
VVLRTSRFFPEADDMKHTLPDYTDENIKANEYLYRRVDLEDVVAAHLLALERAPAIGFDRFIISATTPFARTDAAELLADAPGVVARCFPGYERAYAGIGWRMFPSIGRVYDNGKARSVLGWNPRHDFGQVLAALQRDRSPLSQLARAVGCKGYHRS